METRTANQNFKNVEIFGVHSMREHWLKQSSDVQEKKSGLSRNQKCPQQILRLIDQD